MGLAAARKALEQGRDPGTDAVAGRKAERAAETVAELVAEYLAKYAKPRKRSAAEDERALSLDLLPAWGKRKAKDIKRRDVIALLDRIVARDAPIQATERSASCDPEVSRDRVLSAPEIKAFWSGLDETGRARTTTLALRFQLVTGQRKGEVITLEDTEIDDRRNRRTAGRTACH